MTRNESCERCNIISLHIYLKRYQSFVRGNLNGIKITTLCIEKRNENAKSQNPNRVSVICGFVLTYMLRMKLSTMSVATHSVATLTVATVSMATLNVETVEISNTNCLLYAPPVSVIEKL